MTPLTLIPYAEKIVTSYLHDHPDVAAITTRIMGEPTKNTDTPWVRVTQLDATKAGRSIPERLIDFLFQFDCYAGKNGGQPEATLLNRTVRAALVEMPERETDSSAVVTAVQITSDVRVPDTDVDEPARERYALTAAIWMHS